MLGLGDKLSRLFDEHLQYNVDIGQRAAKEAETVKHDAMILSTVIAGALLLAVGLLGFITRRAILRQLGGEPMRAVEVVKRIAAGDLRLRGELDKAESLLEKLWVENRAQDRFGIHLQLLTLRMYIQLAKGNVERCRQLAIKHCYIVQQK